MNPETIDGEFAKLQQEIDQGGQAIQAFAAKLQAAANAGDTSAREWLLDLKSIAIQVQQEQLQTQAVLQALHDFTVNHLTADPEGYRGQQPQYQQPQYQQPQYQQQPVYAPQPQYGFQQGGAGGMLGRFIGGGFGRAIVSGAGFGIGDDIINKIL